MNISKVFNRWRELRFKTLENRFRACGASNVTWQVSKYVDCSLWLGQSGEVVESGFNLGSLADVQTRTVNMIAPFKLFYVV